MAVRRLVPVCVLALAASACACPDAPDCGSEDTPAPAAATPLGDDVLATVNGVPIRASELQFAVARENRKRDKRIEPAQAKAQLEELVELELARQAAVAAGLDDDADYLRKLRFFEAPFVHFQREELATLYLRSVAERGRPGEAEIAEYFAEHAADLRSELHVLQILVRNDEAKIRELEQRLADGAPFEEVAATLYPAPLPEGKPAPWDLGFLRWTGVPTQWREALGGMRDGDVSDVIPGPKGRFWILKLAERRVDEALTLEQLKPHIVGLIEAEQGTGLRQGAVDELRARAEIVHLREPGAIAPPREPDE